MSTIMVIEIVAGIVILAVAVRFAVRETRRLNAATETDAEPVETAKVPEHDSEPQAQPAAEHQEQKPEKEPEQQLSEVSSTEAN
jgi:Mg2+/citrate symporter